MRLKRWIKGSYLTVGLSAIALLAVNHPAFLGIMVGGVTLFLLLIAFVSWLVDDRRL